MNENKQVYNPVTLEEQEVFVNEILFEVEELLGSLVVGILGDKFPYGKNDYIERYAYDQINQLDQVPEAKKNAMKILVTAFVNRFQSFSEFRQIFCEGKFRTECGYPFSQGTREARRLKLQKVPKEQIPEFIQKIEAWFKKNTLDVAFVMAFNSLHKNQTTYVYKPAWNKNAMKLNAGIICVSWIIGIAIDGLKSDFAFLKGNAFDSSVPNAAILIAASVMYMLWGAYKCRPKQIPTEFNSSDNLNNSMTV
jgi:hypothetical protein